MRETAVVWSPWDFLRSPMQHHRTSGTPQGWQGDNTQGIPTSLASRAWGLLPGKDSWPSVCHQIECKQAGISQGWIWNVAFQTAKKEHFSEAGLAKRCRGARSSWPLRWVLCPLQWEWWFLPHELAESYLPRAQHSTGPPANWSVSAPELPQQLQGLNLRPWSPASNLLESAISNATAQILLLTQDEELRRDFEQIMG